jgi:sugar/nucleoside kinase (ribokinase family)
MNYDFVAIGDLVIDAFIRIKDAEVHCGVDKEHCQICFRFGDKVPYESVTVLPAVGNSPNAAVAAARLGLRSALVSNLGQDQNAADCLASLRNDRVATDLIQQHEGKKTNYHYVLWYGDDRTILIKHEEYQYQLPPFDPPGWIYLSSLGAAGLPLHDAVAGYLESHPEVKLAFQPGTFQIKVGAERLAEIYKRAEIVFMNLTEAQSVTGLTTETDVKKLLSALRARGPKIAIITDGPLGAYVDDGHSQLFMPPYPDPRPPLERTGAGDSFSATVTAALALGLPLTEALRWGPVNSMSVVQQVGAQAGLLTRSALEKYLAQAPADYQPRPL